MFLVAFCYCWKSPYQGRSGVWREWNWWEPGTRRRDQSKQHLNFLIISYTPSFTGHIINIVKKIYDVCSESWSIYLPSSKGKKKKKQALRPLFRSTISHLEKLQSVSVVAPLSPPVRSWLF